MVVNNNKQYYLPVKSVKILYLIFWLILIFACRTFGQSKITNIVEFHEAGAYHLALKKINKLKRKDQDITLIQNILADCYWETDKKERSLLLFDELDDQALLLASFEEKYKKIKYNSNEQKTKLSFLAKDSGTNPKLEPHSNQKQQNHFVIDSILPAPQLGRESKYTLDEVPIDNTNIVELLNADPIEQPRFSFENLKSKKNLKEERSHIQTKVNEQRTSPKIKLYRIRIGSFSQKKEYNVNEFKDIGNVEVIKWSGKYIVYAGYFSSISEAKSVLSNKIFSKYSNTTVVVKSEGRYRSVQ